MKAVLPTATALLTACAALCASSHAAAPAQTPQARAEATAREAEARRKSPVVTAVQKTHKGIVVLKVSKPGNYSKQPVFGTGVIVDERGYVVTAHHVIAGADQIEVHLYDKTVLQAVIHVDEPRFDMAILRVKSERPLTALPFGPGGNLMAGESVIAVGNPYGYVRSISTGIISALERQITMPSGETLTNLTQTSAPVNPGNSGGPLLNINGEWIGLVIALREGAQNIGFALNIDTVKSVVRRNVTPSKAAHVESGLEVKEQVVIGRVAAGGLADRAGLKEGDVVLQVGDRAVHSSSDVERALREHKPGDRVEATVLRDGRRAQVALPIGFADGEAGAGTPLPRPRR